VLLSLRVPGGTAALARAGAVEDAAPRGAVLLDLIHVFHEAPMGADAQRDAKVGLLRAYLAVLSDVEKARAALPDGAISASLARAKGSRRGVEDAVTSIGGELDEDHGAYRIVLRDDEGSQRRRLSLANAGLDPAAIARDFNRGAAVPITLPADDVPLPLGVAFWNRLVVPEPAFAGCLLTAILSDRRASLLYYGLLSLDGTTRAYLASTDVVPRRMLEGIRPSVFATLGRSIRVRAGRVDVPGGAAAVPLWETILDRRASEPERFILELLQRDRGNLAFLYDAVDHLDPARQAFALGLSTRDAGLRVERFKALYAAFGLSLAGIDVEARPFRRVAYDAVQVLASTRVLPSGQLPPSASRKFWQAALSSSELPREPARELRGGDDDGAADAAWVIEHVCLENPNKRQQSVALWLFGQRVFAGIPPSAMPDALVALAGFTRFRALHLTLERMGITEPATYAAAVRQAQRLSEIGNGEAAAASLRQFQGALALVERVRFGRSITAQAARRLVDSLVAVPLSDRGDYQGNIGVWIDQHLLPALAPLPESAAASSGGVGPIEARLLAACAGLTTPLPAARVEWEGLPYRVDVGAAAFDHLLKIRAKQGGVGLDAVLAYSREAYGLPVSLTSPAGVPARIAALTETVNGLGRAGPIEAAPDLPMPSMRELLDDAIQDLRSIKKPKDLAKAERIAAPLRRASDWYLASVLMSLAYAPHLGDPDGAALLAGDPAPRHSFGGEESIAEHRILGPWRLPQQSVGEAGGWRVTGSVLGLDVGLATLGLRRLVTDSLPPPPLVNNIDRFSLASSVVFSNPFDVTDAERDALADAIGRGRARVAGLCAHPSALPYLLRVSGVGEWRQQVLPWALQREPERVPEYFSLADFVRIGSAETTPMLPLDSWGTSALAREGCLCLRYPESGAWETTAGRAGTALVAEQMPDLILRVAESLARLGLPARILHAVLEVATQDVLDAYRPAYMDDWAALVATVRRLTDVRLVDDIAALTSGGPLVPEDREHRDEAQR
jgi:hypothetical protein